MTLLYNEDCLKTIDYLIKQNVGVDLVLTSPPYNAGKKENFSERAFRNKDVKYDVYIDNNENYVDWLTNIFFKLEKILNTNGVILLNISYSQFAPNDIWLLIANIIQHTSLMIGDTIIWKKKSAIPNNVSSNRLTRVTEFIFVICRKNEYNTYFCNKSLKSISRTGQKYYNAIFNYIEAANNNATFSSELVLKLLNMYGRSNIVVYDPFIGTGTTAVGLFRYDKDSICIGSEISVNQIEYAKSRLEKEGDNVLINCYEL